MYATSHSRAAVANNRQGGLGLLGLMLISVILLIGLPSGEEPEAHPSARVDSVTTLASD